MWASMGKLVPQLLGVINFAYNLCFRHVIACWKGIFDKYTLCHQTMTPSKIWLWHAKKHCLGPQNSLVSVERCDDMKNSKVSQLD
jgi:hypothetical protein